MTLASFARRASGGRCRLSRLRPGLPIPGGLWEAQRRAQCEQGSARQGEDSGGDDGGAVARRSRLLKETPPAGSLRPWPNTSPSEAQRAGDPRAGGSGAQGCGRRALRGGRGGEGRGERAAAKGSRPECEADPRDLDPGPQLLESRVNPGSARL